MTDVSTAELRRHLADYLNAALRGQTIYITSNGRRVAALVPAPPAEAAGPDGVTSGRVAPSPANPK